MTVPITAPGHPDAKQDGPPPPKPSEELGPGHVMGNLTYDPELRFTGTGKAVARCRIAFTPRIKLPDKDEWRDGDTEYYDAITWGKQAERVAEQFRQGDRVLATGFWIKRYWTDRENNERSTIELTVRDIGPSLLFRNAVIERPAQGNGQSANGAQ